jgi:hypothetical protein
MSKTVFEVYSSVNYKMASVCLRSVLDKKTALLKKNVKNHWITLHEKTVKRIAVKLLSSVCLRSVFDLLNNVFGLSSIFYIMALDYLRSVFVLSSVFTPFQ